MNIQKSLELARICKYGPGVKKNDPTPTIEESIQILSEVQRKIGFNWITGANALKILKENQ